MRTDIEITEVAPVSEEFRDVVRLGKANRRYLGFLPDAGFADRALKGTLLVARAGDRTLGYILYDLPSDRVKIIHLCIDKAQRAGGLARGLVDAVSNRHSDRRGLELACRRDFPADKMWEKLGFRPVAERPGRSRAGLPLTIWHRAHEHRDLFTIVEEPRELVAIDNNIFMDLTSSRPQGRITRHLDTDWVTEMIELCATDELLHEINKCPEAKERAAMLAQASAYRVITGAQSRWRELEPTIAELAPEAGDADHRHVARAVAAGATYFVTRDGKLLVGGPGLEQRLGIVVIRPEDLITRLDQLRSSGRYEPEALQGTSIVMQGPADLEQNQFAQSFLNYGAGERAKTIKDTLRSALAAPGIHEVRIFTAEDGGYLGAVVLARHDDRIEVLLMRVSGAGRLERAVARQLAFLPRQMAADQGIEQVVIADPHPSTVVVRALEDESYVLDATGVLTCIVKRGLVDIAQVTDANDQRHPRAVAASFERHWWPLKIAGAELPTFMVSIHPAWAEQLFDTDLASATLFGRRDDLGLNREHVYYRGPGWSGGIREPARILWYVKGGVRGHREGELRAISQLSEVVLGRPKTLYQRFTRLGTWSEKQVCEAANTKNEVMALRLVETELFESPISLTELREVYSAAGLQFRAPQSPTQVPERMFCLLYRRASRYGS
jgi:predicted nucleic acid-binding protein